MAATIVRGSRGRWVPMGLLAFTARPGFYRLGQRGFVALRDGQGRARRFGKGIAGKEHYYSPAVPCPASERRPRARKADWRLFFRPRCHVCRCALIVHLHRYGAGLVFRYPECSAGAGHVR